MSLLQLLRHLLKLEKWFGDRKMVGFVSSTFTPDYSTAVIVHLLPIDAVPSLDLS